MNLRPNPHAVDAWLDLIRLTDQLQLAGLRRKLGPHGDVRAAVRQWYAEHCREHDAAVTEMLRRLREPN